MRLAQLFLLAATLCAQEAMHVSGGIEAHDPSVAKEGKTWYVFTTGKAEKGGHIGIRCSQDLSRWQPCGHVFDRLPEWIYKENPDTKTLWAPDIARYKGEYRLYYAFSSFGKNTSGIGLATNRTLDPRSPHYRWIDKGLVLRSKPGDDFNAIDPNFVVDAQKKSWLTFGSFWSGIKLVALDGNGMRVHGDTQCLAIAARSGTKTTDLTKVSTPQAIEAPFILPHDGSYYLFVSWDLCCKGNQSTYNIRVGRARKITGPYLDKAGVSMADGGGTEVLSGNQIWAGPGGQSLLPGKPDLLVFHAYDRQTGKPSLQVSTIKWSHGWPQAALASSRQ